MRGISSAAISSGPISGSLSQPNDAALATTEAPDVASFALAAANGLALAATEAPDVAAFALAAATGLALAATEAPDVAFFNLSDKVNAALAATEAPDTAAFALTAATAAALAATEATDVAAFVVVETRDVIASAAIVAATDLAVEAQRLANVSSAISVFVDFNAQAQADYAAGAAIPAVSTLIAMITARGDVRANIVAGSNCTASARFLWTPKGTSESNWTRLN